MEGLTRFCKGAPLQVYSVVLVLGVKHLLAKVLISFHYVNVLEILAFLCLQKNDTERYLTDSSKYALI